MNPSKLLAIIFCLTTFVYVSPADAKTKHLSLNHTQKHHVAHKPSLRNAQPSGFIDVAALPAYPVEMTRGGLRQRQEPMGRKHIAPSNGYTMASTQGVIGGRSSECVKYFRGRLIPNCGCEAAKEVGLTNGGPGKVGPWDLASNWRQFPSASCAPNMAAWRYGHVFIIKQCNSDGTVLAFDGNSGGGLTRVHTVSLRGYRIVNPSGQSFSARRVNGGQT